MRDREADEPGALGRSWATGLGAAAMVVLLIGALIVAAAVDRNQAARPESPPAHGSA